MFVARMESGTLSLIAFETGLCGDVCWFFFFLLRMYTYIIPGSP